MTGKLTVVVLIGCLALVCVSCAGRGRPASSGQLEGGTFEVEGILSSSEVFFAGPDSPKAFLIRDAQTNVIKAYVQSTLGEVDLVQHVGRNVRVVGHVYQDKVAGLVVEARKLTVLDKQPAEAEAPQEVQVQPVEEPVGTRELPEAQ